MGKLTLALLLTVNLLSAKQCTDLRFALAGNPAPLTFTSKDIIYVTDGDTDSTVWVTYLSLKPNPKFNAAYTRVLYETRLINNIPMLRTMAIAGYKCNGELTLSIMNTGNWQYVTPSTTGSEIYQYVLDRQ